MQGLDGLTIGSLSARLDMSKSGLFAYFGSKEELQLATIDAAAARVAEAVLAPALKAPRGMARVRALCERMIDYLDKPEFPGGCFFNVARAEFHARPGAVRDALAERKNYWRRLLSDCIAGAQAQKELRADADPDQLAYELESIMDAATWSVADERKQAEIARARRGVDDLLGRWASKAAADDATR